MTKAEAVRQELYDDGVIIFDRAPIKRKSIVDPEGFIALSNSVDTSAEEHCVLTHDKWHLKLGAFYPPCSPYQLKAQMEYRVNKRALMEVVPLDLLKMTLSTGMPLEEVAEDFEVPVEILAEAISLYHSMGMAV